jgi:Flp pilus assembly pilin Flp
MKQNFLNMLKCDSGQGYIEYCILVAFIAVAGLVAIKALGVKVATEFNTITASIP